MNKFKTRTVIVPVMGLVVMVVGCKKGFVQYDAEPLGTVSDTYWQQQETNAEATEFIIYEHEFAGNTVRLNRAGEDHIKQIAVRAPNVPFPVDGQRRR